MEFLSRDPKTGRPVLLVPQYNEPEPYEASATYIIDVDNGHIIIEPFEKEGYSVMLTRYSSMLGGEILSAQVLGTKDGIYYQRGRLSLPTMQGFIDQIADEEHIPSGVREDIRSMLKKS